MPTKLVVNVRQPGCTVSRNKCSSPFRSMLVKDSPLTCGLLNGKTELPLNVRTDNPFSLET